MFNYPKYVSFTGEALYRLILQSSLIIFYKLEDIYTYNIYIHTKLYIQYHTISIYIQYLYTYNIYIHTISIHTISIYNYIHTISIYNTIYYIHTIAIHITCWLYTCCINPHRSTARCLCWSPWTCRRSTGRNTRRLGQVATRRATEKKGDVLTWKS